MSNRDFAMATRTHSNNAPRKRFERVHVITEMLTSLRLENAVMETLPRNKHELVAEEDLYAFE